MVKMSKQPHNIVPLLKTIQLLVVTKHFGVLPEETRGCYREIGTGSTLLVFNELFI